MKIETDIYGNIVKKKDTEALDEEERERQELE